MNYVKKLFFSISLVSVLSFVSCAENKTGKDTVTVYDKDNVKIIEIVNQDGLDYISELIGNSVENLDEENVMKIFEGVPKDAVISYRYKFSHEREDGKISTVNFDVYENYRYITLKGIPIISPLTWELSEEDNKKLQKPKEL